MTVLIYTSNRNIGICTTTVSSDRWIKWERITNPLIWRRIFFKSLITNGGYSKWSIHRIFSSQQTHIILFFNKSARKNSFFRLISICIYIHCIQYSISSTTYYPPEIVSMRAAANILYIKMSGKKMISIKSQCVRVSTAKMKILITYSQISDDLLRDYHKLLILSNSF